MLRSTGCRWVGAAVAVTSASASVTNAEKQPNMPNEPVTLDPVPTPAEAPHLLEGAGSHPKPFLHPKAIKAFTMSMVVGAACAGSVFMLLSKTIADQDVEERALIARIAKQHDLDVGEPIAIDAVAKAARRALLGNGGSENGFVAASTFADIQKKADAAKLATANQRTANAKEVPMLHQEAMFRLKRGWNDALTNVQLSIEAFAIQYKHQREAAAEEHVIELVRSIGADPKSLRRLA